VPAGAYDEFAATATPASAAQRAWTSSDGALPALYIGHGAPPLLDDAEWMTQLAAWTHTLPKPRAVLIVSAHWEAAPLMLSAPGAATPLVHDFGGLQQRYYTLTYPTPDASLLARGDVETLARFRSAPGMPYAHPTADHFLPLFVTLGAAADPSAPVRTVINGYWMGLAKRSFQVS